MAKGARDSVRQEKSLVEEIFDAFSRAEDRLSRLDARVSGSTVAAGWRRRIGYDEAVAWLWNGGELVAVDELVLYDEGLERSMPEPQVARAAGALRRRRRASQLSATELRDWGAVQRVVGRRPLGSVSRSDATAALLAAVSAKRGRADAVSGLGAAQPPPLPFLSAMDAPELALDQDQEIFEFWLGCSPSLECWPALVQAVVRLDLWTAYQPLPKEADVGGLIVEADLRAAGRLAASPLLAERGRRALGSRGRHWASTMSSAERAVYWLDAIAAGAEFGLGQLDALSIARQRLDRLLKGRRVTSRLPQLVDLFLGSPVVTAPLAARTLGISQQAARTMIEDLGSVVREITGQRSYRVWRV